LNYSKLKFKTSVVRSQVLDVYLDVRERKIKFSPCLIKLHAMKTYGRGGGIAPRILNFDSR
jgi:hypothetical protein